MQTNNPTRSSQSGRRSGDPLWIVVAIWGCALPLALIVAGLVVAAQFETPAEPALAAAGPVGPTAVTATTAPVPRLATASGPTPTLSATASASPTRTRTSTPTTTLTPTPRPSRTPFPTRTVSPTASASTTPSPYPDNRIVIGYSVAGRPLEVYRFGSGPIQRMIVAGIHGGYEWNTIALADRLIAHLGGRPELIPPGVTLFILRSLNPDGEARVRGVDGRVNDNGVDLNRNWPALWQADWPRSGCWIYRPVTGGVGPGSEPETAALMNFLLTHRVDALISYHSAALGIFAGGQPPDAASLSLAEAVNAVSDYPYPAIDTGCQFTGQLIDWASLRGIAAVDIELTNHRDTDFEQNLGILSVLLAWRR